MNRATSDSNGALHILTRPNSTPLINEPLCISVPFSCGEIYSLDRFELIDNFGRIISAYTTPLSFWKDKSIRWLLVKANFNIDNADATDIFLRKKTTAQKQIKNNWVIENEDSLCVCLPSGELNIETSQLFKLEYQPANLTAELVSTFHAALQIGKVSTTYELEFSSNETPYSCQIIQSANVSDESKIIGKISLSYDILWEQQILNLRLKLQNTQAQVAQGGKWDLGNENSLFLASMALEIDFPADYKASCYLRDGNCYSDQIIPIDDSEFTLTQHSSGGKNWQSAVHKTCENEVELHYKGAKLRLNESESFLERAQPTIQLVNEKHGISLKPKYFWQKFPNTISLKNGRLTVEHCNTETKSPLELQPGESKSHDYRFCFADSKIDLAQNSQAVSSASEFSIPPARLDKALSIPWFSSCLTNDVLQKTVDLGLHGDSSFFSKREIVDEYGWRNFGDLYADHEADNYQGDDVFVSHYNNQYDPLLGFLKQWLISGNPKWRELADDLYDHTINIDIYRTDNDKPEYNNGLFWHTDHYVQAETASHRTYSQHQASNVYMDHAGGGGPGSHHCYSSGLCLYYFLTGDEYAYETVIKMAQWMRYIYEGDGTILGKFLQLKNANQLTIPFTSKLLLGFGTGIVRNPVTNKYPLDRGTGNYVNTLLDAYELTQDTGYLADAEKVILNTIDKNDDIAKRNFSDIENTWFYTVFLQSVAKYIHIIATFKLERMACQSAFAALMHYIDYIYLYEKPALDSAEILEYPNDTWTAQDIRKVQLLCIGSLLTEGEKKEKYILKAQALNQWICNKLEKSHEQSYTRILALTMQNYGGIALIQAGKYRLDLQKASEEGVIHHVYPTFYQRIRRFISNYSIVRERRLLLTRIPKLQKLLGKP
ncbi:hypothetical protein [Agaribacter flavus]|uniref:Uncharacterized protein n=1 Tax=Agaribacter flavus TaxID=1902781 RepID=A0ABV7FTF2_9ALTE